MSRLELRPSLPAVSRPWLRIAALSSAAYLAAFAIALCLGVLFAGYAFDDPFITYRYTENLLAGRGFTYNSGTRVLSTTTPLYALLLVLPGAAGLPVPLASNILGCASIGAAALALWRLGELWGTRLAGWLMLLLFPLNSLLLASLGGEGNFYVALILWAFVACSARRYVPAAALLAAATLARADGVLAAGAAALFVLLGQSAAVRAPGLTLQRRVAVAVRGLPWPAITVFVALLATWAVFAQWYFGSPLPATLAAKQAQGQMSASRSFLRGLYGQVLSLTYTPLLKTQLVFAVLGLWAMLRQYRGWLLLLGWSALYAIGYTLLGVSGYFWYYVPLVPAFVALVALGIDYVAHAAAHPLQHITHRSARLITGGIAAAVLVALVTAYAARLPSVRAAGAGREAVYRRAGTWLRDNTPPDASAGTLEVGIIGYYAGRTMIDFAGLLQPDVARILGPNSTYDDAALYANERYRPDYLVLQRGVLPKLEASIAACRLETSFSDERYAHILDVYACDRETLKTGEIPGP